MEGRRRLPSSGTGSDSWLRSGSPPLFAARQTDARPLKGGSACARHAQDWTSREAEVRLAEHSDLRRALGLERVPDHTTRYRFMRRVTDEMLLAVATRLGSRRRDGAPRASATASGRRSRASSRRTSGSCRRRLWGARMRHSTSGPCRWARPTTSTCCSCVFVRAIFLRMSTEPAFAKTQISHKLPLRWNNIHNRRGIRHHR